MRRIARKLCLVGLLAFVGACIVFYIYEHLPWPWGGATLPGGMSDAANDGSASMQWQLGVMGATFAVGFSGALFLVVGGAICLFSWLRTSTRQLPNPK